MGRRPAGQARHGRSREGLEKATLHSGPVAQNTGHVDGVGRGNRSSPIPCARRNGADELHGAAFFEEDIMSDQTAISRRNTLLAATTFVAATALPASTSVAQMQREEK